MNTGIGKAHGKIILMGEHSVVYGYPSIAVPFTGVEIIAEVSESDTENYLTSELYTGPLSDVPEGLTMVQALLYKLLGDFMWHDHSITVTITSNIPAERGMGSSASVACALIRAFYALLEAPLSEDTLLAYADFAEQISHGNPSGLDARVAGLNQPLLYTKNMPLVPFQFHTPYWLVVADTGIAGNTKAAVAAVNADFNDAHLTRSKAVKYFLNELGTLTQDLKTHLTQFSNTHPSLEYIAQLINQSHHHLSSLQVSSPELDYGVQFSLRHGAVAAKLTGGGRGGCFYALTETKTHAQQLAHALMAEQIVVNTWQVPFSSQL